jgi:phosphopentomutase
MRRLFLIILDSLGVGGATDADRFGDAGADTLAHTAEAAGGLALPNLDRLGLRRICPYRSPLSEPERLFGSFGRMAELSAGKDTISGHWEIAGLVSEKPFPLFPDGFPRELMERFWEQTGHGWLGNEPASGTEIIGRLGAEHLRTGKLIVYTSADSVFQIAAHEGRVPPEELYRVCEVARRLLNGPYRVCRVIARPFAGEPGNFHRTERRRDFSVPPPGDTVLNALQGAGVRTIGVGKIGDIFAGVGLDETPHPGTNAGGMALTKELAGRVCGPALVFTNLVDFDMLYGHRRDPAGYAGALRVFDAWLPRFLDKLINDDLLIITADHGCDPTAPGTDHTREQVPLLVYGKGFSGGVDLGCRDGFHDVAATAAEWFGVPWPTGKSFLGGLR